MNKRESVYAELIAAEAERDLLCGVARILYDRATHTLPPSVNAALANAQQRVMRLTKELRA